MAFGPNSTNPRERRAYADAMLAKASRSSATLQDFEAARAAVNKVGDTAKARSAHFPARLASAALRDVHTNAIVTLGRDTLDPAATPPRAVGPGFHPIQLKVQERTSKDYVEFEAGVSVFRNYWERTSNGVVENFGNLTIVEHEQSKPYIVPLIDHETIDVAAVRMLPDQVRAEMAALAIKVTE